MNRWVVWCILPMLLALALPTENLGGSEDRSDAAGRQILGSGIKALTNFCTPHPGLEHKSWYDPYRAFILPATLRNISYNGRRVDCNPASCDNPPQCGIPPCAALQQFPATADYKK